jgi:hypothetical protein
MTLRHAVPALLLVLVPTACGSKVVIDTGGPSGSSGTGGTFMTSTAVTGTGAGGMTSTGTGVFCVSNADCPATGTLCNVAACVGGACAQSLAPEGTACSDSGGQVCDGGGHCVECNTAFDCTASTSTCQLVDCIMGACQAQPATQGTPCTDSGGKVCDGMGDCVACLTPADCPPVQGGCAKSLCEAGNCGGCTAGAAACCLQMCEDNNMAAYVQFVGHELLRCGCAGGMPCSAVCTAECANPQSLTAGSPCGMCLQAEVVKTSNSPCTVNAATDCIASSNCAPFVQCGLACP